MGCRAECIAGTAFASPEQLLQVRVSSADGRAGTGVYEGIGIGDVGSVATRHTYRHPVRHEPCWDLHRRGFAAPLD